MNVWFGKMVGPDPDKSHFSTITECNEVLQDDSWIVFTSSLKILVLDIFSFKDTRLQSWRKSHFFAFCEQHSLIFLHNQGFVNNRNLTTFAS